MEQAREAEAAPGPVAVEGPVARWSRRALTIPGVLLGAAAGWALAPIALAAAALADLRFGRGPRGVRAVALGLAWLACEAFGLLAAGALGLARALRLCSEPRAVALNYGLQNVWARALFGSVGRILGLKLRVDDPLGPSDAPMIVFARHASLVDALLPTRFVSVPHGTRLRHVMKRELLLDPCLDVVGQRLPNTFIRRGSHQGDREADAIARLARGIGPGEGVAIFPEGTRFSPEKQAAALARLEATGDPTRLARARALRHLLPVRSRGALAVLAAAPEADAVFLAHAGFDGADSAAAVLGGVLAGRTIRVRLWRVAAKEIPAEPAARLAWLEGEWTRMDEWLEHVAAAEREEAA